MFLRERGVASRLVSSFGCTKNVCLKCTYSLTLQNVLQSLWLGKETLNFIHLGIIKNGTLLNVQFHFFTILIIVFALPWLQQFVPKCDQYITVWGATQTPHSQHAL